jgi:superfamily I DNA/RNA helicase
MAEFEEIARAAVERIVGSGARHRLVVAGPGTGKTHLFGRVLEGARDRDRQVVLTFINNLKNDLDRSLGHAARVFTFHGYCHHLLRTSPEIREGLSGDFHYYPAIVRLVDEDWTIGAGTASPRFVRLMRNAQIGDEMGFYLARSNYYDSIGFDDSVFRVYVRLKGEAALIRDYDLVLVDEYQDFNRLEAELIGLLRSVSPTLIAGDDDQALYSLLREAKAQFIRDLHTGDHYENFELPFCMRSTQVIVEAVGDVVIAARGRGKLADRIDKPYQYYPPKKAADSERYP